MDLADYHIHTKLCGHATGEAQEYVDAAKKAGLAEIGFSDHIPQYFFPPAKRDSSIAMDEKDLPGYVEAVRRLQQENPDIKIKLGIEADFAPGQENKLKAILDQNDFDYVLGSVHYLDSWGFDNAAFLCVYERWDIDELYRCYFGLLRRAAESRLFDILAHADLIKKFGYFPKGDVTEQYRALVKAVADADMCVEVNTAGLRVPAEEIYPSEKFLRLCFEAGLPLTLGSDAHCPEQVGYEFSRAVELLTKIGYRQLGRYEKRQRTMIDIKKIRD